MDCWLYWNQLGLVAISATCLLVLLHAYADDLVLIAPTLFAMRTMLRLCERYADDYNVVFYGSKSNF